MGSASKRSKKSQETESESEDFEDMHDLEVSVSRYGFGKRNLFSLNL